MISDLSLVGCYNMSYIGLEERNKIILASAKHNLKSMAFFALTEFQKVSCSLNTSVAYIKYVRSPLICETVF